VGITGSAVEPKLWADAGAIMKFRLRLSALALGPTREFHTLNFNYPAPRRPADSTVPFLVPTYPEEFAELGVEFQPGLL
jgi:hypothetical protein